MGRRTLNRLLLALRRKTLKIGATETHFATGFGGGGGVQFYKIDLSRVIIIYYMASTGCMIVNESHVTPVSNALPVNRGKPWLDNETRKLLQNIKNKKSIDEIAAEHGRTTGGITSRLRQLASDYNNEGRSIEDIQKFTGLTKEVIEHAIRCREISHTILERKRKEKRIALAESASKPYIQQKITSFL